MTTSVPDAMAEELLARIEDDARHVHTLTEDRLYRIVRDDVPWLARRYRAYRAELDRQDTYITALRRMVEQLELPGGARITFAADGTAHVAWPVERGEVQA